MSTKELGVQELFLQFHIQGLHTTDILAHKQPSIQLPSSWPTLFLNSALPPTLPLLFRIPRSKCQPIMKEFNPITAESDILFDVHVSSPPYMNRYSAIHLAFADQIGATSSDVPSAWKKSCDLLVFVHIPAWNIVHLSRKSCEISLRLKNDALAVHRFVRMLGLELVIFQTSIWDTQHVIPIYTDQFPPVVSSGVHLSSPRISGSGFEGSIAKISFANNRLEATAKIHFSGEVKSRLASSKAPVDSFQNSPCTFGIDVANFQTETIIPFPFDRSLARIRIARKSGWVEAIVPFTMNCSKSSFNFSRLVILKENPRQFYCWNLPRLLLNIFPLLDLDTKNKLDWINPNISSAFSVREHAIRKKLVKGISTGDEFVDFKMNMHTLFTSSSGTALSKDMKIKPRRRVFFLDEEEWGIMSVIFVVSVRLEQCDNTLVVDSYVLPLVPDIVERYSRELFVLNQQEGMGLRCTEEEYKLWTLYIRASVERSRTWNHGSKCNGKLQGGMIGGIQQYPCRCGAGKVTEEFTKVAEWKPFAPFVTRCLFTPLFPVQCLEEGSMKEIVQDLSHIVGERSTEEKACWTCKSTETLTGTKLLICAGCSKATYCSKKCQKEDWKTHKLNCRA